MLVVNVGNQGFELFFRPLGRKVSDLRFEGTDQIGGRVDDGTTKCKDRIGFASQMSGHPRGVGVEPNAE